MSLSRMIREVLLPLLRSQFADRGFRPDEDRLLTYGKPLLPICTSGKQMLPISPSREFGDILNGRFFASSRQRFASYRGNLMSEVTVGVV